MVISKLGALIVLDRAKAISDILDAFTVAEGNRTKAAKILDIPLRSLHHYVKMLGLWPAIDSLCEAKGFTIKPGKCRKTDTV